MTIDQFPLEWDIDPLIVLDCIDFKEGYVLTPEDIDNKLGNIGDILQEGNILCVHTNAPKHYRTKQYINNGVGVGKDATLHIVR